jgi:hypothetical protein
MDTTFWLEKVKVDTKRKTYAKVGGNDRMDLWEIRWEGVNCIHLAQGTDQWRALVNTVMNLLVT